MSQIAVDHRPLACRQRHSVRAVALELAVVATVFQLYRAGRGITRDADVVALHNAGRVISWERALGIFTERDLQRWVLSSRTAVELLNRYYVSVHFPVTIAFLTWAYVRHVDAYRRIRTWFVAVTLTALVIHVLFPLAPPRMTHGFVDTLRVFGPRIYTTDTSRSVANQFAAMPSLHFGWALMVAVGTVTIVRRPAALLAFAHPLVTLTAIVATGNHYWFDSLVAGLLVAVAGAVLSVVMQRPASLRPRFGRCEWPTLGPRRPGGQHAPTPPGEPRRRTHAARDADVRPVVRRPRPGGRAGYRHRYAGRLVDRVRERARRVRARGARVRGVPQPATPPRPGAS
jgi:hypothetical protein